MKRGYFVHPADDGCGFAIVATSVREAKKIGFAKVLDCDFLDVRARWLRLAVVDDLKIGVVTDEMLALRRGFYGWLEESVCDICNRTRTLSCVDGKAMCEECEDKLLRSDDQ